MNIKLILLILAIIITAGTFYYTQNLVNDLQESEREIVELYANSLEFIASSTTNNNEDNMRLKHCHNFQDFRLLAKKRLPSPIFNYIDGGADDESTYRRNTEAFESCDLIPSVLTGIKDIDLSVTVMGQKLDLPVYCSPTALQRLFHHEGERVE